MARRTVARVGRALLRRRWGESWTRREGLARALALGAAPRRVAAGHGRRPAPRAGWSSQRPALRGRAQGRKHAPLPPPPPSYQSDTPRPSPRTNRTRRVPPSVPTSCVQGRKHGRRWAARSDLPCRARRRLARPRVPQRRSARLRLGAFERRPLRTRGVGFRGPRTRLAAAEQQQRGGPVHPPPCAAPRRAARLAARGSGGAGTRRPTCTPLRPPCSLGAGCPRGAFQRAKPSLPLRKCAPRAVCRVSA
jgi:hypothetical protein